MSFWKYVALQVGDRVVDWRSQEVWVVTRHNVNSGTTHLTKEALNKEFHDDDEFGGEIQYWAETIMRDFLPVGG